MVYRLLEKKLGNKYMAEEIIHTKENGNVSSGGTQYMPTYERTDLTDELHEKFQIRTEYGIIK